MKKCVLGIAAEFEKPYWREWAEWHHNLGFDDIWIITNDWNLDDPIPDYVKTYRRDGKVIQLKSYNEWMLNHRKEYEWALVCDIDEFLYMPVDLGKWLNDRQAVCSLGIPWIHFGDGGKDTPTSGSVIERFTKCEGVYNRHVKVLVNLRMLNAANSIFFVNPHFACVGGIGGQNALWLPWLDIFSKPMNGPYNAFEGKELDPTRPFIAHFYTKTMTEWRQRRGPAHMRADCHEYVTEDWFERENHNNVECRLLLERKNRH